RGVERHHVGLFDHAGGTDRDQVGVAGAEADAVQGAAHSAVLASALTAAAVMAEPPRRPCTVRNSSPRVAASSASACLDSQAPMNPTGQPTTAAGLGAPAAIISSRWNSAVGALPIATTAPSSRSRHSSSAAAERVVPSSAASAGV